MGTTLSIECVLHIIDNLQLLGQRWSCQKIIPAQWGPILQFWTKWQKGRSASSWAETSEHQPLTATAFSWIMDYFLLMWTHGIMGKRFPDGGLLRYRNESLAQLLGDVADMQLPCYQTRESPSSGKCSIFCYRLTSISKMCSMHSKHFTITWSCLVR